MPAAPAPLDHLYGYTTVDGAKLATRRLRHPGAPRPGAPVLVFLHEGLGSIELWGAFPAELCAGTGLDGFIYDRLGHGRSDPLPSSAADPGHMHAEARTRLPVLLARNRITRCILIGHSDGGSIGLIFAAENPRQVQGIITQAAHVFVDHVTLDGVRRTAAAYARGGLKNKLARYHGDNTDTLFRRWADTWRSPAFSDWNLEAFLPRITCPVLAIQGREDEYGLPSQVRTIAAGVGGPAQAWIVPDCRHAPHHQAREAVLTHCADFILRIVNPPENKDAQE